MGVNVLNFLNLSLKSCFCVTDLGLTPKKYFKSFSHLVDVFHLFHVLHIFQTYSMNSHPGWQDSTIFAGLFLARPRPYQISQKKSTFALLIASESCWRWWQRKSVDHLMLCSKYDLQCLTVMVKNPVANKINPTNALSVSREGRLNLSAIQEPSKALEMPA